MTNNNSFLKYRSKSEKSYYEFTDLFDLTPIDVLIMQYCMKMFRKSTSHGKHGKDGKCFYRDDDKLTGFYIGGHHKDIVKDIHAKTSVGTVKNSLNRLQNKFGLLYHHKSINHVQIFFPIFDEDVRESFNDPDYKTVINFNEIWKDKKGYSEKQKKVLARESKINFTQVQKLALRKVNNSLSNNVPKTNVPKKNDDVVPTQQQHKTKVDKEDTTKNNKWIRNTSKNNWGIPTDVIKLIGYNAKNAKIASNIFKSISYIKGKVNLKYNSVYYSDYYKNENNPYVQGGGLKSSLEESFNNNLDLNDLKKQLKLDYSDYMDFNATDLSLKDQKANNERKQNIKLYEGFNEDSYLENLKYYRKQINVVKSNNNIKELRENIRSFNKWNKLACKYTDLTPDKIKNIMDRKQQDHKSKRTQPVKKVDYEPSSDYYKKIHKDKKIAEYRHGYSVLHYDGGSCIAVDIDSRKKHEIEAKDKKERAKKNKQKFDNWMQEIENELARDDNDNEGVTNPVEQTKNEMNEPSNHHEGSDTKVNDNKNDKEDLPFAFDGSLNE